MLLPELQRFVELFVRWNASINLSAARTVDEVTLQVVDCLALEPYVDGPRLAKVFPRIPSGQGTVARDLDPAKPP